MTQPLTIKPAPLTAEIITGLSKPFDANDPNPGEFWKAYFALVAKGWRPDESRDLQFDVERERAHGWDYDVSGGQP